MHCLQNKCACGYDCKMREDYVVGGAQCTAAQRGVRCPPFCAPRLGTCACKAAVWLQPFLPSALPPPLRAHCAARTRHVRMQMDTEGPAAMVMAEMDTMGAMLMEGADCPYSNKMCKAIYKKAYGWGQAAALRPIYLTASTKHAVYDAMAGYYAPMAKDLKWIKCKLTNKLLEHRHSEIEYFLAKIIKLLAKLHVCVDYVPPVQGPRSE